MKQFTCKKHRGNLQPETCPTCAIAVKENQALASIPARFTDPAYAKQERKVARVERSIRRNVR
jgi:hypothetical protein